MHPWHDLPVDCSTIARSFPVVIEVPMGSKNNWYELDKASGLLRLAGVLYSSVFYPANYGFVPRTDCDDGDPLDVLVFGQEPVAPLTLVDVRAIGVMQMRDEKGIDDKIPERLHRGPGLRGLSRFPRAAQARGPRDAAVLPGLQGARRQAGRGRGTARSRRSAPDPA